VVGISGYQIVGRARYISLLLITSLTSRPL
jgi:hypothetical protein